MGKTPVLRPRDVSTPELRVIGLLAGQFEGVELVPSGLGGRWIDALAPLHETAEKDADRAGELLDVYPTVDCATASEYRVRFGLVGHESGIVYGTPELTMTGDPVDGGLNLEALEQLRLYLATTLLCAVNGPARFSAEEKAAIVGLLGKGTINCDLCEHGFAFWEDAVAHEQTCSKRLDA